MFTIDQLNINDYIEYAKSHVGEVHDLQFQTLSKRAQAAGKFEILDFVESENPHFDYSFWRFKEAQTPDEADLGYYFVKMIDTKFYNNKIIKVPVIAYVQHCDGASECFKTKALFISHVNAETNKTLKAYSFGILDFRSRA